MKTTLGRLAGVVATAGLAVVASGFAPGAAQERDDAASGQTEGQRLRLGILNRDFGAGVMVEAVMPGSPAHRVGIMVGDRIVSISGHPLDEPLEDEDRREFPEDLSRRQARLEWLIDEAPQGEPIRVDVERGHRTLAFQVVPELLPDYEPGALWYRQPWPDPTYDSITERFQDAMERVRLRVSPYELGRVPPRGAYDRVPGDLDLPLPPVGVTPSVMLLDAGGWWRDRFHYVGGNLLEMVQLNPELGAYFGTEEGVLVLDVDENVTLGLRAGDVVVSIGGRKVDEVSDMHRILSSYEEDEAVDFGIWRDGARATVVGTIR